MPDEITLEWDLDDTLGAPARPEREPASASAQVAPEPEDEDEDASDDGMDDED